MFQAFCCFSQGTDLPTAVLGGNTHCRSSFSPVPVAEAQLEMKHFKTRFFLHVQPETPPREPATIPPGRDSQGKGKQVTMAPIASQISCYLQEHPGQICWDQRKTRRIYVKCDKLGRFALGLSRIPFSIAYFYTIFILNQLKQGNVEEVLR